MNEVSTLFGINGTNIKRHEPEETNAFPQPPTYLESYVATILYCRHLNSARLTPTTQVLFCNDLWPQKIQLKVMWYRPKMAQQKAMVDGNWEPNTSGVILLLIFPSARPKSHVSELTSKAPSHGASLWKNFFHNSFLVPGWFLSQHFLNQQILPCAKSRLLRNWRCANTWAKDSGSNC